MSAKVSLVRVLAGLSEDEARAAYNALAQWVDNERNGLDEDAPRTEMEITAYERVRSTVVLVEAVVGRLDAEIAKLVG